MKKIIFTLIGVLIGLFFLLSFLTSNPEYKAEKKFWKMNQRFSKIIENPNTVTMAELDETISQIEGFLKQFPNSDLVPYASLFTGDVYVAKKNYTAARQLYEKVIELYPDEPRIVESAIVRTINSYFEEEQKSDTTLTMSQNEFRNRTKGVFGEDKSNRIIKVMDALDKEQDMGLMMRTYFRAIHDFPTTSLGIQAPFLIAKLYHDDGKPVESQLALNDAIAYYQKFISDHKNTDFALQAQELLVSCYLIQDKTAMALDTLGQILMESSESNYVTDKGRLLITNFIKELAIQNKEFDRSIAVYKKFLQNFPGHSFKNTLEERLEELKELKSERS